MNILAVSAGTINGNNDAMAKEALMGAQEMGASIEFINLNKLNLKPCTGCIACVTSLMNGGNGDCVIKDDFKWIENKILDADGVLIVVPVFEKAAPALFNILQDRMCGPAHDPGTNTVARIIAEKTGKPGPDPRKFKKKAVAYIAIGGSDWTTKVSSDLNSAAMSGMWKVIDEEVFQWSKGIMMDDAAVARCHQIGVNLAKACADIDNAQYVGLPGLCPICNSRNFYFDKRGMVICEVCGIEGALACENGCYTFSFDPALLPLAHTTLSGKMKHMDDIYANETKLFETKKTAAYKARRQKYIDFIQSSVPK
jgi:multimeric flavodoxin WrbA